MAHRVDHEEKVVEREVLTVICMFFEEDRKTLNIKNGFEDVEILAEQKIGRHGYFFRVYHIEGRVFLCWSVVGFCVVLKNLSETPFDLLLCQHNRLVDLGRQFRLVVLWLGQGSHEL